jgi:hypothetical protein
LPSFSKKKQVSIDDSATRDLRRLLRLECWDPVSIFGSGFGSSLSLSL